MDTRPYRLPWPTGTLLFVVASSESHELAEAVLAQTGNAYVQRGCLLRRVNADLQVGLVITWKVSCLTACCTGPGCYEPPMISALFVDRA